MSEGPVLVIFGGLPGVGKTTIAKELSRRIGAMHIRIDSIEQALRDSGKLAGDMDDAGYREAYESAEEHLRSGHSVVADCVNPLELTRDAWRDVARRRGALAIEVEITCSDQEEHRRRVEQRGCDIPGLQLPTWGQVLVREYEIWDRDHVIVDTAHCTVRQALDRILDVVQHTSTTLKG